jgi:hypothetical protein
LEILALRHQLGVLQRSVKRPKLSPADRFLWAWLSSFWNGWESRVSIVKAATVIGWQLSTSPQGQPSVESHARPLNGNPDIGKRQGK